MQPEKQRKPSYHTGLRSRIPRANIKKNLPDPLIASVTVTQFLLADYNFSGSQLPSRYFCNKACFIARRLSKWVRWRRQSVAATDGFSRARNEGCRTPALQSGIRNANRFWQADSGATLKPCLTFLTTNFAKLGWDRKAYGEQPFEAGKFRAPS